MGTALYIAYVSAGSVLLPLSVAFISWINRTRQIVPLVWLLIASLTSDLVSFILFNLSLNSYPLVNSFLLIQFVLCFSLLVEWQQPGQRRSRIFLIVALTLFVANMIVGQGIWVFNSHSNSLAGLILIFAALRYFFRLLQDLPETDAYLMPSFWIAVGVLFYYSGTLLLFVVNNYLTIGIGGSHQAMWILHNLTNIIKNLFFGIALWQNYRNKR